MQFSSRPLVARYLVLESVAQSQLMLRGFGYIASTMTAVLHFQFPLCLRPILGFPAAAADVIHIACKVQTHHLIVVMRAGGARHLQVWNRYRSIPSSRRAGGSSLDTLFDEFDKDGDGHLTAAEIASALNS